jgi:hypothetical protein
MLDINVRVTDDIKKTLSALEANEEQDDRDMRKERGENVDESTHLSSSKQTSAINMSQTIVKKTKIAMPEMMKSKLVNDTAMKAAGGTLKSWMIPGNSAGKSNTGGVSVTPVDKTASSDGGSFEGRESLGYCSGAGWPTE